MTEDLFVFNNRVEKLEEKSVFLYLINGEKNEKKN